MNIRRRRFVWLAVISSVLAMMCAEIVLRESHTILPSRVREIISAHPRKISVPHSYIGHLNKPDRFTDPYGFRNEWPWPDTPGIITLGDSVTLGSDVEASATWPAVLARAFPEHGVVNLALTASGPQQYLRVFETFGTRLRPRLILIGFFARNDFWDAAMFERWLKSGAGGNYLAWRDYGRPSDVRLSPTRPVGELARSAFWRAELAARRTYVGDLVLHASGRFTHWSPSDAEVQIYEAPDGTRFQLHPAALLRQTRIANPERGVLNRVFATVERIRALAQKNGGHALVIFLPSLEEVYLPLLHGSAPDAAAPLRAALEQHGVPYLDLLEAFRRAAATGESLFLPTDRPLLSERGHGLTAELVISELRQRASQFGL